MQVAADLFGQRGFAGVTVKEIAETIGVSGPAFYMYWSTKQQLLVELLDDRLRASIEAFEARVAGANTPYDVLIGYADVALDQIRTHPSDVLLLASIPFFPMQGAEIGDLAGLERQRATLLDVHLERVAPDIPKRRRKFAAQLLIGLISTCIVELRMSDQPSFVYETAVAFAQRADAALHDDLVVPR